MRFKPPTMLRNRKVRSLLAAGSVLVAVGGLAFAQAVPAHADPTETLVVVGSDTIQDVWNAFTTQAMAPGLAGSYNATNPATGAINEPITPTDGWAVQNSIVPNPTAANPLAPGTCSFERPNGSGQGVASLRLALNASSTNASKAPGPVGLGCVDIARSSSVPDVAGTALSYVPFGIDELSRLPPARPAARPASNCPTFTADLGNGTHRAQHRDGGEHHRSRRGPVHQGEPDHACTTAARSPSEAPSTGLPVHRPLSPRVPRRSTCTCRSLVLVPGRSGRAPTGSTSPTASPCVHDHIINGALAPPMTVTSASRSRSTTVPPCPPTRSVTARSLSPSTSRSTPATTRASTVRSSRTSPA